MPDSACVGPAAWAVLAGALCASAEAADAVATSAVGAVVAGTAMYAATGRTQGLSNYARDRAAGRDVVPQQQQACRHADGEHREPAEQHGVGHDDDAAEALDERLGRDGVIGEERGCYQEDEVAGTRLPMTAEQLVGEKDEHA